MGKNTKIFIIMGVLASLMGCALCFVLNVSIQQEPIEFQVSIINK